MAGVGISLPTLSREETQKLYDHLRKHKIYPYQFRFRKLINAANFPNVDGALGSYFTLAFTPANYLGVVSLATNFIITPNTTIGEFCLAISYSNVLTLADNGAPTVPDGEGQVIYQLKSNGGAINDFQVFYPLNWFVEARKPLYIHFWADAATVAAAAATVSGHCIPGTLVTNQQ